MWTLILLLLPSISRCAPPFSQDLKNCDDSGPRVSELSLNSALSTFLCYTEEEIGAMEEVEKKRKLAQKIAPLFHYEHSYEDLVEELLKVPSDSLVKIVNEVMNNRNAEIDHNTVEEYRSVFDEHIHLNNGLEDLERNGRNAFLSNFESWFSFGEGPADSPNTATPQILTSPQTFRVSVGGSVLLPCSVHNLGSLVPLWKHRQNVLTAGRQMVNPDTYKYQLVNDYNLQIRNIRAFDAGDYTCYITTSGQPVTLTHTIEIFGLVTDGGWSEWSAFSLCSATCGDATKSRTRTCNQPEPANGGKDCVESNEESVSCGHQTCVCTGGKISSASCFCKAGYNENGETCEANQKCSTDGTCVDVCAAGGVTNSAGCFCQSDDGESGDSCSANQGCTHDGTCLDVCNDGPYLLMDHCFCVSTNNGGMPCKEDQKCQNGQCFTKEGNDDPCSFDDSQFDPAEVPSGLGTGYNTNEAYKWLDNNVLYYFDDGTSQADINIVENVMEIINKKISCFTFEKKSKELLEEEHSLQISIANETCSSPNSGSVAIVQNTDRLQLTLSTHVTDENGDDCGLFGLILHELMHVLGVAHPMRRKDRGDFIEVKINNMIPAARPQYKICEHCRLFEAIPYDCRSIMHYGYNTFKRHNKRAEDKVLVSRNDECNLRRSTIAYYTSKESQVPAKDWEILKIIGQCYTVCTEDPVSQDYCFCKKKGGATCYAGQRCIAVGTCHDVCSNDAACEVGQRCIDGMCQSVCTSNAVNSDACFCQSSTGGMACPPGQGCNSDGTCQSVCSVDAVIQATCFCESQNGGAVCTSGKRCSGDGTCSNA